MKQVLIRQGRVVVEDMPAPRCGGGELLVRTAASLISTGTEIAALEASAPSGSVARWARRARSAGEVARMALDRGAVDTVAAIRARLEGAAATTGYSLAGTVIEVGADITDLAPGERIACAGAGAAHHAEVVAVPRNLVVPIPPGVSFDEAAFVTVGAIALEAVRRAEPRIGEVACVVGLGLVGQLVVELLHASGARVVGADLDARRVDRARAAGLELGATAGSDDLDAIVERVTDGRGVDVVLLTASTSSSEPIRQAVRSLRRRGRVVVVGSVGMDLDRNAFYEKEAELRIARSYGPGRHDPSYELEGRDYPYEYVRWTENRNMGEFLRLVAIRRVSPARLVDCRLPLERAVEAYARLAGDDDARPLAVVLDYPGAADPPRPEPRRLDVLPPARHAGALGVALVGPGGFARSTHLPNLATLAPRAVLRAVVGRTAQSAREAARRFAASYATTDIEEVLADPGVDLVLICTRHDLHAEQAARAIEAGKAVFLEKPAAVESAGLERLAAAVRAGRRPFTVGFNRRFAPAIVELRARLASRRGPVVLQYRVNAGGLAADHWLRGERGGGRLLGEACHMIDLLAHLVGARRVGHSLDALAPSGRRGTSLGDDFALTCRYADGSQSSLIYTSLGHESAGKERIEAHWEGHSASLEDFRETVFHGERRGRRRAAVADKGHRTMLDRFIAHVRGEAPEPIPLDEIFETSRFLLELDRELRGTAAP